MAPLTADEIHFRLRSLTGWRVSGNQLTRTFQFELFLAGIRFVDAVAVLAEAANHHPDIDIRYNKVTLHLTTHDAGGLTEKDFALAAEINALPAY